MSLPLPSPRNFDIFAAVEDRRQSLRTVGAEYGMSPQRVQEIVQQVERWYEQNTAAWRKELDLANRATVAYRRHDDRMKVLYDEAMKSFEQVRHDPKASGHKVRLLNSAMYISRERFLSSIALMKTHTDDDEAEIVAAPELQNAPPVGVLAQPASPTAEETNVAPADDDETPCTTEGLLQLIAPNSATDSARELCTAPWRAEALATPAPAVDAIDASVDIQAILAEKPNARPAPPTKEAPLTRKQRQRKQQITRQILGAQIRDDLMREAGR